MYFTASGVSTTLTFSWMSFAVMLSEVCGSWYRCLTGGVPGEAAPPPPSVLITTTGSCRSDAAAVRWVGRRLASDRVGFRAARLACAAGASMVTAGSAVWPLWALAMPAGANSVS